MFVGTLSDSDATTGRFAVQQIRAGSLDGYAVETIVDVRFDDDIRFLRTGQQYLVGAIPDPITGVLRSKVRLPAPLFGGDAVIGVDDTDLRCPRVEDGVKTLLVDGTEVDTGVLAPLKTAKRSLLRAVLKPLGIAIAVLAVLATIKLLVFAMVRAAPRVGLRLRTAPPGGAPGPQTRRQRNFSCRGFRLCREFHTRAGLSAGVGNVGQALAAAALARRSLTACSSPRGSR